MSYDNNNIFARILRDELPSERVFEDALTVAFMDIMPQADGHVLVVPREAAETLLDLSLDGAIACIKTTHRIAAAVHRAFDAPGFMVAQMNGAASGQSVPHVHFHIIPRWQGEAMRMHAAVKADPAALRAQAQRIRQYL